MPTRALAASTALAVAAALLTAAPSGSVAPVHTVVTSPDQDIVVTHLNVGAQGSPLSLPAVGPAFEYPSLSEKLDGRGGTVADVDVTLTLRHAHVSDLDVLLVGPDGRQATLMSDVGGDTGADDVTLTLDDEADFSLPQNAFTGGRYQATNYDHDDAYPSPAPPPTGSSALSVFDGASVEGVWRLYAVDDTADVSGLIITWSLLIGRATRPYPSTLAVGGEVGVVTDLDVHLSGLYTNANRALDLVLVGPGGRSTTIISDAALAPLAPVDLVIDDEAASPVPELTELVSGRYRPANYPGVPDLFPAPAPPDPGTADLSVFDGTDPRGTWELWGAANGKVVVRIDGWSLDIEWSDATGPAGSVTVAGGQPVVTDPTVSLAVAGADPSPGTSVARMRFSNDGVTWSAYQPFASSAAWTLPGGDGQKTVYAQLEDAAGNTSAVISDSVRLDTLGPLGSQVRPARKTRVRRGATVVVRVSEPLLGASVTSRSVRLVRRGKPGTVPAKVRYDPAGQRIVVDPRRTLAAGARYRLVVTTGVVDLVGHAWDQSVSRPGAQELRWSFRTR